MAKSIEEQRGELQAIPIAWIYADLPVSSILVFPIDTEYHLEGFHFLKNLRLFVMSKQKVQKFKSTIHLPKKLSQKGSPLLDQQMWCWGHDVRREEGNLLLLYGAQKHPSPNPRYHSAYSFSTDIDSSLILWGWGIWIANKNMGSVFIRRAGFRIIYTAKCELAPQAWCEQDLPFTEDGIDLHEQEHRIYPLLVTAFEWISGYENWLSNQIGTAYREDVVSRWQTYRHIPSHHAISAVSMTSMWISLSTMLTSLLYPPSTTNISLAKGII